MRRQFQPAREVPLHAVAPQIVGGAGHGPTGGKAHDASGRGELEPPFPLAAGSEHDVAVPLGDGPERRSAARFWTRRRDHASHAVAGRELDLSVLHARAPEITWLTPPATPVYLVPDTPDVGDESPSRLAARAAKRTLDLAGAVVGIALAAPLLVVLAILVRIGSPGPVLFAQARVGRGGRVFRCYKFRTMRHDAESLLRTDAELRAAYERNGFKIPCDADHRVTRVGRVLRLTSCDELPQLWNVLKGEMSLVGPRPLVVRELAHYPGADRDVLLSVRPGLTGAWAVGGRSRVGYPERAAMELDYVRRWTIGRDLAILLRTVGAVLARHGAG